MAKTEAVVGSMASLLMVRAVLGSIMCSRKRVRERPRLKGFEMALSNKDLESFGQRHIEGMEDLRPRGWYFKACGFLLGAPAKGLAGAGLVCRSLPSGGLEITGSSLV